MKKTGWRGTGQTSRLQTINLKTCPARSEYPYQASGLFVVQSSRWPDHHPGRLRCARLTLLNPDSQRSGTGPAPTWSTRCRLSGFALAIRLDLKVRFPIVQALIGV